MAMRTSAGMVLYFFISNVLISYSGKHAHDQDLHRLHLFQDLLPLISKKLMTQDGSY